jgi:hypothetical protein
MLKTALRVFGRFKTVYLEYKARSSKECPENPWSVQNNAVFVRLDSFLERLHDILDFTQTIMMFRYIHTHTHTHTHIHIHTHTHTHTHIHIHTH